MNMKLNISAKELLALYNILYERYEAYHEYAKHFEDGDPRAATDEQLKQLYGRVKAILVASLSNKMVEPLDSWLEGQRRKVDELKSQNEKVKQEARTLADEKQEDGPIILSAEDDEVLPDSYPRKRPPPPTMPRGGKYHGHRR